MENIRTSSLTIRGFSASIEDFSNIMGTTPNLSGEKGKPARPGVATILKKSFLLYERPYQIGMLWDQAVNLILESAGGAEKLKVAFEKYKPELVHVSLAIPIKASEEQEDGYISVDTMSALIALNASFGLSFID